MTDTALNLSFTGQPHIYANARTAIAGLAAFEAAAPETYAYDVLPVFGGANRDLTGYQVRVKDLDGFGVGYLEPIQ